MRRDIGRQRRKQSGQKGPTTEKTSKCQQKDSPCTCPGQQEVCRDCTEPISSSAHVV